MSLKSKLKSRAEKQEQRVAPNVVVRALAGTGKTTTLVEGLKYLQTGKSAIRPSEEQEAVWEAMRALGLGDTSTRTIFCAFNKSIAVELGSRLPKSVQACTLHSLGKSILSSAYGYLDVDKFRSSVLLGKIVKKSTRYLTSHYPKETSATVKLVGLCKCCLLDPTEENLVTLCHQFDVPSLSQEKFKIVFKRVRQVLELSQSLEDKTIDYNDMIWLPVVKGLSSTQYDVAVVDESQDLNPCQQELAIGSSHRVLVIGDQHQAIYGFAGADCDGINNLSKKLEDRGGVINLPLNTTRRCGKLIVEEAKKYVPEFVAHEDNLDGLVSERDLEGRQGYRNYVEPGNMVLARTNAMLVQQCFKFLKEGDPAKIQGRSIGKSIYTLVERLASDGYDQIQSRLKAWRESERRAELSKDYPDDDRLIAIDDKVECIEVFLRNSTDLESLLESIDSVFSDNRNDEVVLLSSIHRAKGLESNRVFFINNAKSPCPHPMAKSKEAKQQELNLLYVGITRAIKELVWVR